MTLFISATKIEIEPILKDKGAEIIVEKPWECYMVDKYYFVISGIGKSLASGATAFAIMRFKPTWIVNLGIAGAYPKSNLGIGEVLYAVEEIFGDEPLEEEPLKLFVPRFLEKSIRGGRFVTLSKIPETLPEAEEIEKRTQGICENMEGASIAKIANLFGIRCTEIRAISNIAGIRDKSKWRMDIAIINLNNYILSNWEEFNEDENSL